MFNKFRLPRNYSKALKNLELVKLDGGTWIDAGCGVGTYTISLSSFVDKVIAIDTSENDLKLLNNYIKENKISNIESIRFDFNNDFKFVTEKVDGILFSFSLHFQRTFNTVLENSYKILKRKNGKIVIIEYERKIPVPWIPYPITEKKMIEALQLANFTTIISVFKNSRFYILEGIKG